MTTSVTRPCFTKQYQTCKTKTLVLVLQVLQVLQDKKSVLVLTKTDFLSQTGLVLRPTVSDHITGSDVTDSSREFQTREAATGKARSSVVGGITSMFVVILMITTRMY